MLSAQKDLDIIQKHITVKTALSINPQGNQMREKILVKMIRMAVKMVMEVLQKTQMKKDPKNHLHQTLMEDYLLGIKLQTQNNKNPNVQ